MIMFHIAFGIGLIALVMGLSMIKCCCCKASGGEGWACGKWMGYIVTILAIISLGCLMNTGWKMMNGGMMMEMEKNMEQMHKMKDDMKKDMGMEKGTEKAAEKTN
jgi:hypothetical protein